MNYAQSMGSLVTELMLQIPMALVAILFFGLRLPHDLPTWAAFLISALLGYTVMFFFNWFLACLTFYTTEIWGLGVLIDGMTFFLSGALVPLVMMPAGCRTIVLAVPFAQALGVPHQPADGHHAAQRGAPGLAYQMPLDPWYVDLSTPLLPHGHPQESRCREAER